MSPVNASVLVAATNDGIWKSVDAGATWTVKKTGGDFKDMIFKPVANSSTIYAVTSTQFFRSTDMGETWSLVPLSGNGLTKGGRIAVSKADPAIVYLTFVGDFVTGTGGTATPVLKSTNSGESFSVVKAAGSPNLNGYNETESGQGNYNYNIIADPTNANTLYVSGHCIWKSTNGGTSWNRLTNWYANIHTDMHDFEFSPADPTKLFNINDGGIWLTTNGGVNWTPKSDGLETTECYHSAQSPLRKDMNYIGTQDNGELYYSNNTWYTNRGGDWNSKMEVDYQNATMAYYTQNGKRRSFSQGEQSWAMPVATGNDIEIEFTPLQTNVGFVGKTDVYRTTNLASNPPTWTKITNLNKVIRAIESSQADANILYVLTQDGQFYRSDNALSATPTFSVVTSPGAAGTRSSISGVKNNSNVVYVTCGPKVYRSSDKGASWTNITGSLPAVNIIKIYHDPYSTDESMYVGLATGVYYRNNTMTNWTNFSNGLPTIANITDFMLFHDGTSNNVLRVSYYGRGVWESPLMPNAAILRSPENPPLTSSGLDYNYYTGSWSALPNFEGLTPAKSGMVNSFDVSPRTSDSNYAFKFTGYISVPADGQYTFYTNTDDGSRLYIGENLVVNNDDIHGAQEKSGTIGLKAGKHALTVTYFQGAGGQDFQISYQGAGIPKQIIPGTVLFRLPTAVACSGTGTIQREQWNAISGTSVSAIPVNAAPASTSTLTLFEGPTDVADNYGSRIRGYVCAPYTGKYTFWIASDDNSELWVSTSENPAAKVKIISFSGAVPARSWEGNASQKSAEISLVAGQKYYIEALHKEGGGGDNLAVGWQLPTGIFERPIPGNRLAPFSLITNTLPSISITSPAANFTTVALANIEISATASDAEGAISKVEFFNGSSKIGDDNTSPYNFTWTNVAAGTYSITAKATDAQGATTTSAAVSVTVTGTTALRNPENPASTVAGVQYKYYEGNWSTLPSFTGLTPIKSGNVNNFDLSIKNRQDQFGCMFTGYVNIPVDGTYTFYLSSDDGSRLWIGTDNILVVDNDGLHGNTEKSGTIGLKAGKHAITVTYFEQSADEVLSVSYAGPSIAKQLIPNAALFRITPALASTNANPAVSRLKDEVEIEKKTTLKAYPNPAVAETNIEFALEESGDVSVFVSDYQGRIVAEVYKGYLESGKHVYQFNALNLSSGNYICKMITKNKEESITIVKVSRPAKAQ
jgi:photosystem II stability/assembly factor-like uncharacterized protein